jgi:hypothetical protein
LLGLVITASCERTNEDVIKEQKSKTSGKKGFIASL